MDNATRMIALQDAGDRLAAAANTAGLDAKVPSCPDWTVRDLLFHTGSIHRWAAGTVREVRTSVSDQVGGDPLRDAGHRPADGELLDWFTEGHAALITTLREAPPDLQCWAFLPAPRPLEFWIRRQTHETTIHRADAELAAGKLTQVDPQVAVDGIDELLTGFVARRRGRLRTEQPKTLSVQASDAEAAWHVTVSAEPVVTVRSDQPADATLRGPASDVYLALWNRLSFGALDAFGDAEVLRIWPSLVQIRWG